MNARYATLAPHGPGRERYEPLLARAVIDSVELIEAELERIEPVYFEPVVTDHFPCIYGVNDGSPRQRMRHDARLKGERCRTHPYQRIN